MPLTYALFESAADLRATVNALRKTGVERSSLSFIGRDLESDIGEQDDRRMTIAQVLQALDLGPVAMHLDPFALVVVPEGGTFLTAGWSARHLGSENSDSCSDRRGIHDLLGTLGHSDEEAEFLNRRLQAGVLFLGVSNPDENSLARAREIFADQQAVYVGVIESESTASGWDEVAIPRPNSAVLGELIIVDVSASILDSDEGNSRNALVGATLVDEESNEIGTITATISDPEREPGEAPAYVVVEHGGFLGVRQSLHVLPSELVEEQDSGSYRVRCNVEVIENGPAFDAHLPFSRREEQAVCAYYGTKPHWED
jgi:hypothetical protein